MAKRTDFEISDLLLAPAIAAAMFIGWDLTQRPDSTALLWPFYLMYAYVLGIPGIAISLVFLSRIKQSKSWHFIVAGVLAGSPVSLIMLLSDWHEAAIAMLSIGLLVGGFMWMTTMYRSRHTRP